MAVAGTIILWKKSVSIEKQWLLFLAGAMRGKNDCEHECNGCCQRLQRKWWQPCVSVFHHYEKEMAQRAWKQCHWFESIFMLWHSFNFSGCSLPRHLETRGRIRTRRRLCTCEHTLLWYFVFSHPTERDGGSFTPAESVTRHEACLSLCSIHLGEQTSQSHSQLQLCTFFFFAIFTLYACLMSYLYSIMVHHLQGSIMYLW